MPADILYEMYIPTCILVFKKCRENPDDILLIDASLYFEKVASKMLKNAGYYCKLFQCQPSRYYSDQMEK